MSNVITFPNNNLSDLSGMLRNIANMIDEGEFDAKSIIALVLDEEDELSLCEWGESHSHREIAGIIADAQHQWMSEYRP